MDISEFAEETPVSCPYCGSTNVIKWGFSKDRVTRRYKCMDCPYTFSRTTNTVISHTHKDTSVWEEYILLTLEGASLHACAKRCKIAVATAFSWRYKIMAALATDLDTKQLSGVVEMDETFVRISYKGNHKNSKTFKMPRPTYKRGPDNRGK